MDFFSVFLSLINGIFRFTSTRLIMKAFDVLDVNCRLYFFFILFPSRYASITQNSLFWSQFSDRWVYWSSIYESLDPHLCISWTLYTFSIFILFLIFIFRLSLLLSFSSLNLAPVYIFFCFAWYINPICNSLYKVFQDFCRWDRYIWLLIFFHFSSQYAIHTCDWWIN